MFKLDPEARGQLKVAVEFGAVSMELAIWILLGLWGGKWVQGRVEDWVAQEGISSPTFLSPGHTGWISWAVLALALLGAGRAVWHVYRRAKRLMDDAENPQ